MTPDKIREVLALLDQLDKGSHLDQQGMNHNDDSLQEIAGHAGLGTWCGRKLTQHVSRVKQAIAMMHADLDSPEIVTITERSSDGSMRMYIATLCALVEILADAAEIDLADTELTLSANGAALAARTGRSLVDGARAAAGMAGEGHG